MRFVTLAGYIKNPDKTSGGYAFCTHDSESLHLDFRFVKKEALTAELMRFEVLANDGLVCFSDFAIDSEVEDLDPNGALQLTSKMDVQVLSVDSIALYPTFDPEGNIRENGNKFVVIAEIYDLNVFEDTGERVVVGVRAFSPRIKQAYYLGLDKAADYYNQGLIVNGSITEDGFVPHNPNCRYASIPYRSEAREKTKSAADFASKQSDSLKNNTKAVTMAILQKGSLLGLDADIQDCTDDDSLLIANIKDNIRVLSPVLYSQLINVIIEPSYLIETACATENMILINPDFVRTTLRGDIAEATFLMIHEMYHILLMHSALSKVVMNAPRTPEDPPFDDELLNIAMDVVINSTICKDFGIVFLGGADPSGRIKTPDIGCYIESLAGSDDYDVTLEDNVLDLYYTLLNGIHEAKKANNIIDLNELLRQISNEHNKKRPKGGDPGNQPQTPKVSTAELVERLLNDCASLKQLSDSMGNSGTLDKAVSDALSKTAVSLEQNVKAGKREECVNAIQTLCTSLMSI